MAVAGRAVVRVHPIMRAPPPRLVARCTPRAWPGAAMPSRMGGWSGIRSTRPAQRSHRAVLVQVRLCLVIPQASDRAEEKAASLRGARRVQAASKRFLPFEEAREIVRKEGLESQKQWWEWSRPANIPSRPDRTYAGEGWVSWPDWLGYDEGKPLRGTFLAFEEARALVWEEGLQSKDQWKEWSREHRPATIPSNPDKTYKDEGWLSWPDWLGFGEGQAPQDRTLKDFLEFEEARAYMRKAGLESYEQWQQWCRDGRRPENIPSRPDEKYADEGWVSWPDWLGCGEGQTAKDTFLEFEEARAIVWEEGLESVEQWKEWCTEHRPDYIPYNPDQTYKDEGWLSWPDWLGYGKGRPPRY